MIEGFGIFIKKSCLLANIASFCLLFSLVVKNAPNKTVKNRHGLWWLCCDVHEHSNNNTGSRCSRLPCVSYGADRTQANSRCSQQPTSWCVVGRRGALYA